MTHPHIRLSDADEAACWRRSCLMEYEAWRDYLDTFPRGRCGERGPRWQAWDEACGLQRQHGFSMHALCYAYAGDRLWFLKERIAP